MNRDLPTRSGRVLVFWPRRHYGFILPAEGGDEIFFHEMGLVPRAPIPQKNDRCEYTLGQRNGKPVAENVRIIVDDAR